MAKIIFAYFVILYYNTLMFSRVIGIMNFNSDIELIII